MEGAVGRALLGGDGPLVRDGVALRLAHHGRASLGRSARRLAARTHPLAGRGKAQLRRVLLKGAGQALAGGIHDARDSQNLLAGGKHVKCLAQKLAGELVECLGDVAVVLCLLGPSPLCHASANQRGCTHHMIPARRTKPRGRGKPATGRAAGANRPCSRTHAQGGVRRKAQSWAARPMGQRTLIVSWNSPSMKKPVISVGKYTGPTALTVMPYHETERKEACKRRVRRRGRTRE